MMTENHPPPTVDTPGQPFYEKTRQHLKELLVKRKLLERSLASQEEALYKEETDYLEETPNGNIITGFESYTKAQAPGAMRKRTAVSDANRVFSRSSIGYGGTVESPILSSALSTPIQPADPAPLSANMVKARGPSEGASSHATPTSTGSGGQVKNPGGAAALVKKTSNNKRPSGDDSESEARDGKKARTGSVAARK